MIAGVISREHGEPWGELGMSSESWLLVDPHRVAIADLVATQPGVLFAGLIEDREPEGGDPFPHVVVWRGVSYLEDGHHRVIRWALAGRDVILARVLTVDS